jgi:glycosyltransferase involved in cell wall biosynthesis
MVTCHNETRTLHALLLRLFHGKTNDDEIIIIDDYSDNKETIEVLKVAEASKAILLQHPLENNYGAHKNYGIQQCSGDYIFQLDGDELPPESLLGENLHALIESNPTVEAYTVPRINDFRGVTDAHAKQWGWKLTESPSLKRPIVNFPDHQWRIFKRDFPRIGFTRKLHEKIEGYNSYVSLPSEEDYALYHDKSIEKQLETNISYNKRFTPEENRGHSVFR